MNKRETMNLLLKAKKEGVLATLDNDELTFKVIRGKKVKKNLIEALKSSKEDIYTLLKSEATQGNILNSEEYKIRPYDRTKITKIPLSYSQRSAWFSEKTHGNQINMAYSVIRFRGKLKRNILVDTLSEIVHKNETFRTLINSDDNGNPYQQITPLEAWETNVIGEKELSENKNEAYFIQKFIQRDFDLSIDFPFQATLICISDNEHVLVLLFHHICTDEASENIFFRELKEIYTAKLHNKNAVLPANEISYADYAVWQTDFFEKNSFHEKLNFWKETLQDVTAVKFPYDYSFNENQTYDNAAKDITLSLPENLSEKIKSFCGKNKITDFIFFITIFNILIYKYTNENDICIGTPGANRTQPEVQNIIGFFINAVAIRTKIDKQYSFEELVKAVKDKVLHSFSNQDVPFEKILNELKIKRTDEANPIYNIVFNYLGISEIETDSNADANFEGLEIIKEIAEESKKAEFDTLLTVAKNAKTYQVSLRYNTSLYASTTAQSISDNFQNLVANVLENSTQKIKNLSMCSTEDVFKIVHTFNDSHQEFPSEKFLIELFETQVQLHPNKTAVIFNDKSITYSELDELSNQFANYLQKKGIQPQQLIPVYINRSLEMMVVLLGIMKTGAAYVAIPTEFGLLENRIQHILQDTEASLVVSDRKNAAAFNNMSVTTCIIENSWNQIPEEDTKFVKPTIKATDLAYIVYTSGSSGKPKAVLTHHLGLVNFMQVIKSPLQINKNTHFLGLASYSFDGSCMELYLPLLHGGKVTIAPEGVVRDVKELKTLIKTSQPSHLHGTPSLFQLLVNSGWENAENALIMSGGEALSTNLKNTIVRFNNCKMWNLYGPTETTLYATHKLLGIDEPITIGKPIANYKVYIVDEDDNLVPEGVHGELLIGGIGVAKGYLNATELTEEKFIHNSFTEETSNKIYRTGDIGKWNSEGEILLKGRKDNQVILRGYRVELNEIKAVLEKYTGIKSFELLFVDSENSEKQQIVLFIIPKDISYEEADVREFLKLHLPNFMIPSRIIKLEEFPLNRNGKTDKKALLKLKDSNIITSTSVKGDSKIEKELTQIWEELLQIKGIGITDDFFILGGNSLIAIRLIARIKKTFNIEFPINQIFEYSTIETLSKQLIVDEPETQEFLTKINGKGDKTPIFCPAPVGGSPLEYNELSKALGETQPFYGFFCKGLDGKETPFQTIEEMAATYVDEIQKNYKGETISLGGYSFGACVAFEMAYQLEKKGTKVEQLFVMDGFSPDTTNIDYDALYNMEFIDWILFFAAIYNNHTAVSETQKVELTREEIEHLTTEDEMLKIFHAKLKEKGAEYTLGQLKGHIKVYIVNSTMSYNANAKSINAPVTLFRCTETHQSSFSETTETNFEKTFESRRKQADYGWSEFTTNTVSTFKIPGTHLDVLKISTIHKIAETITTQSKSQ